MGEIGAGREENNNILFRTEGWKTVLFLPEAPSVRGFCSPSFPASGHLGLENLNVCFVLLREKCCQESLSAQEYGTVASSPLIYVKINHLRGISSEQARCCIEIKPIIEVSGSYNHEFKRECRCHYRRELRHRR